MNKKDWTPEELKLKEVLNQSYENDTRAPSKPLDLSFMNDAPKKRTVQRRRRLAYIAAAISLIFISSFATAIFISNDYASAIHDKIQRKAFEKEHGVIVVSNGDFAEESETVWEITDFETAKKAKDLVPELPVPGYVPEGYEFEKLVLHQYKDGYFANYLYASSNHEYQINCQTNTDNNYRTDLLSPSEVYELSDRTIFVLNDSISLLETYYMFFEQSIISLNFSDNKLHHSDIINICAAIY